MNIYVQLEGNPAKKELLEFLNRIATEQAGNLPLPLKPFFNMMREHANRWLVNMPDATFERMLRDIRDECERLIAISHQN